MLSNELVERLISLGVRQDKAERAVFERGLTEEDIDWNARLERPPHWKETADPKAEVTRRAAYLRRHGS